MGFSRCRYLTQQVSIEIIVDSMIVSTERKKRKYTDHDIQYNAEAPDVVARTVVRSALQYFRRSIGGTAAVCPTELVCGLDTRKAEVWHFDVVVYVQQNVFAFQISARSTRISNT